MNNDEFGNTSRSYLKTIYSINIQVFISQTILKSQWLFSIIYDILKAFYHAVYCYGKKVWPLKEKNKQFFKFSCISVKFMDIYFRLYKNSIRQLNNLELRIEHSPLRACQKQSLRHLCSSLRIFPITSCTSPIFIKN